MTKRHKTGSRPDGEIVRLRMQSLGAPVDVIAAEISRRYGHRPRQAYRLAHGWNQTEAAERYNQLVQARGTEHAGRDTMSPSRVSEYERWPDAARKPSVYALATFAELYGTMIRCLMDAADLEQLSATERTAVLGPAFSLDTTRPPTVVVMDAGADPAALQRRRRRAAVFEPGTELSTVEEFLMEIADQSQEAAALAEATNTITAAESGPAAERDYISVAFAHTNAAVASIATGDLDSAMTSINTVLALPSSHRLATLSQRLERAQRLLTAPAWQGSKPARELHAQISDFRRDTVARALIT